MSKYIQNIRGVVNVEITNKFASHLGTIVGNHVGIGKNVMVGRDLNVPSQMIKRSLTTGLMSSGVNVIDLGIAPIPVIHYGMGLYDASVMITISKSHLRPEDIDIKILSEHEIPLEHRHAEKVPWNQIGQLKYVHEYQEPYIKGVLKHINNEIIKNKAFLVVLDCEEGVNIPLVPQILDELDCETVLIRCKDSECDIDFPEPSPKRISLISELTTALGADIGIVLDNDRDRAVFIDQHGNIIRDQTILSIFAKYALNKEPGRTIVSSIVASQSLDEIVSDKGGDLIKTSIDTVLNEIDANNAIFGGDEPGMYVFPEFQTCFDAIFAVMKMLEILAKEDTTLSTLAGGIEEYNRTGFTIECEHEKKDEVIETFMTKFESGNNINTIDGIRVGLEDSFILIRPSRFEPLIRVYIESKSAQKLQELTESVKKMIENV
ncbi:MAG: phosphomannomutase [Methanobacterium sp.]|uniref:phosphomannomutase n=1 Tax=Methanobacterium sp. TaxID=2164 RepID=UPI003D64E7D3|nr:phosphomannomutase [Methanobacterium sp.]